MRAVNKAPLLDQIEDRLLLPGQQAVDRATPGITILQCAGVAQPLAPAVRADIGEVQHRARPGVRPPVGDGTVDQP
jgi:hypothetical protein